MLTPRTRSPHEVLRILHRVVEDVHEGDVGSTLEAAARDGATFAEVDCRETAGGVLVSAHSPRTLDGAAWLADATDVDVAQELRLDVVLESAQDAGLGVYLDVKAIGPRGLEALSRLLARHAELPVVLASHRGELLRVLADLGRPTSVLYASVDEDPAQVARDCGATWVHPCWERLEDPASVLEGPHLDRARAAGLGVVTWHEERADQLARLLALGVDGICTDDAPLLARLAGA